MLRHLPKLGPLHRSVAACALLLLSASSPPRPQTAAPAPATRIADTLTVTVHEGTELVAVLSPDGRKIAILLLEQVFVVDRQGGLAIPLTDPVVNPDQYSDVAWAPDSRQVVVKGWTELSVIDVVTRESRLVSRRGDLRNPIWTPDGRSILVAISVGDSAVL